MSCHRPDRRFGRPPADARCALPGQPAADRGSVTEIDLLAFADGLLDRDPARRATVQRFLAANPEQAARIEDFMAQNEALRLAGEPWVAEPVPERLLDVVYADPPNRRSSALRIAAAVALLLASAGGGWLTGVQSAREAGTLGSFAEYALIDHDRLRTADTVARGQTLQEVAPAGYGAGGLPSHDLAGRELTRQGMAPITWLTRRIALEIDTPDLGAYGYRLVEQHRLTVDGDPAVRLSYRSADGHSANLYLRPRWEEGAAPMRRLKTGELTVLHWLEGPLAIALTTEQADPEEPEALARAVRQAVAKASLGEAPSEAVMSQDARLMESATPELRRLDLLAPAGADPKL